MALDPVTLQLAKKHTDEAISNLGGGGGGMSQAAADKRYLKLSGGTLANSRFGNSRVNIFAPENIDGSTPLEIRSGIYALLIDSDMVLVERDGKLGICLSFDPNSVTIEQAEADGAGTIHFHTDENVTCVYIYEGGLECGLYKDGLECRKNGSPIGGFYFEEGKIRFHANDASGTEIPAVLSGLAEPVLEDEAVTKKYVDENAVSKTLNTSQELAGALGVRGDGNCLSASSDMADKELMIFPDRIEFLDWNSGENGIDIIFYAGTDKSGYAFLEFNESISLDDIIIRGVTRPQDHNDVANKEYVDEADEKSTLRFAEQGGLHGVRGTAYNQMLSLLPNFFQKVDKAGSKNAALINEVNDPTFSDGSNSWTLEEGAEIVTGVGLIGNSSLFVHSTGLKASQVISGGEKRLTAGHVYYASAYFHRHKTSTGMGLLNQIQVRMRIGENETVLGSQSGQVLPAAGDWVRRGFLFTVPEEEYDEITLCLGISGNTALAQKGAYIDGVVLLDLTNYWGAGNEPDYDWCKNYLPFFSYKNHASGYVYTPKQFTTMQDVDAAISTAVGDIAAALDAINGEVV